MSAIKINQDYTFCFEKAVTWNVAQDVAPIGIITEDMEISIESTQHDIARSYGIRGQNEDLMWEDTFASIPTAKFNGPITPTIAKVLFPGILTIFDSEEDIYVFKSPTEFIYIKNPAESVGEFFTLTRKSQLQNDSVILRSAVPKSVKLSCDIKDNNGILMGDWEFIGRGYESGLEPNGIVQEDSAVNLYKFSELTKFKYNTSQLLEDLVSFEININNNAKFVNDLPTGGVVFPKWDVSGSFKILASAGTEAFKNEVLSSSQSNAKQLEIMFKDGTDSLGAMAIYLKVYLTKWSSDYKEGEVITFEFKSVQAFEDLSISLELPEGYDGCIVSAEDILPFYTGDNEHLYTVVSYKYINGTYFISKEAPQNNSSGGTENISTGYTITWGWNPVPGVDGYIVRTSSPFIQGYRILEGSDNNTFDDRSASYWNSDTLHTSLADSLLDIKPIEITVG